MRLRQFAEVSEMEIKAGSIEIIHKLLTIPNPEYVSSRRFALNPAFVKEDVEKNLVFCVYNRRTKTYTLPRNFPAQHPEYFRLKGVQDERSIGTYGYTKHFKFIGELRDYQNTVIDKIDFNRVDDISIIAPAGTGKTIYGAYVTVKRKVKTLVCVPRDFLAEQWENAYNDVTNLRVLRCTPKVDFTRLRNFKNYDVVILGFDLFNSRVENGTMPQEFLDLFGHFIVDELHRIGAPTYLPTLERVKAKYRTGLTATLRRADGMHRVIPYHFGTIFKSDKEFESSSIYPLRTGFKVLALFDRTKVRGGEKQREKNFGLVQSFFDRQNIYFRHRYKDYYEANLAKAYGKLRVMVDDIDKEKSPYSREVQRKIVDAYLAVNMMRKKFHISGLTMVDTVAAFDMRRNRVLLGATAALLREGRKVLFISKRKEVLYQFAEYFKNEYNTFVAVQETMKKADALQRLKEAQLIFGIAQITKEGLDVPDIDTIVLHLPVSDIEQTLGRATRLYEGKKKPLILVPQDEYTAYMHMNNKAAKSVAHKKKNTFHLPITYEQLISKIESGSL